MKTLREAEDFGIECDQRARPFGYRLRARPAFADFERIVMNPDMALLLKLVETYLSGLLPGHLLSSLEAHFEAADRCLARDTPASRQSAAWLRKVALSPVDLLFSPARIAPRIFKTVSEALFCSKKLEVTSWQTDDPAESFVVSPVGLVHGKIPYLVCRPDIGEGLRHLELTLIRDARMLNIPVAGDEGFSVYEYLRANGAVETTRAPP